MIFKAAKLRETNTNTKNPDRGWYQIYPFRVGRGQAVSAFEGALDASESLALILLDLGAYKDRPLDENAKSEIRALLDFFTFHQRDIIIRPTYDRVGKAIEAEPSFYSQVEEHAGALARIFSDYNIFLMQGAGVGAWGELHDSRFTLDAGLSDVKRLMGIYQAVFKDNTYLSVRTPAQHRLMKFKHMGLFNDAMMSSETDMGTYGQVKKRSEDNMGRRSRSRELQFICRLGRRYPIGGEVVWNPAYTKHFNNTDTINLLRQTRVSYLNSLYDRQLLDFWEQKRTGFPGKWMLTSMYDYVGAHLGYRFVVTKVTDGHFFFVRKSKKHLHLVITVENKGFAPIYRGADVYYRIGPLEISNGEKLDLLMPGNKRIFSLDIDRSDLDGLRYAERKVYICARRRCDGAPVHFSNETEDSAEMLLGTIE